MGRSKRTVVEIRADLHQRIKQLALLNDLRIYEFPNGIGQRKKSKLSLNN
ncbi:MAG: hypothetical protein N3E52_01365 [Candidatus Bathyarchaeota archaeon]|nr:hypothetical protein [Candidatus Bathyarchaeota archaeon]